MEMKASMLTEILFCFLFSCLHFLSLSSKHQTCSTSITLW